MKNCHKSVLALLCVLLHLPLWANAPVAIPDPLISWKGWVLKGYESSLCPVPYNSADQHYCVWPTNVSLNIQDKAGQFEQRIVTYVEGFVSLPGDKENYPYDVKVNGKFYPVIAVNHIPSLFLTPGEYTVTGAFSWETLPDNLLLPQNVGTLTLKINDKTLDQPDRDNANRVWIRRHGQMDETKKHEDSLSIKVFRLMEDGVPQLDSTLIRIIVSGKPREVSIGPVFQENAAPLSVQSPLPAQLTEQGMLRLQIRPGQWDIVVKSHLLKQVNEFSMMKRPSPWPSTEIWSFQLHPNLRVIDFKGGISLDPKQTDLPQAWWNFPAFLMKEDNPLMLVEKQRGQLQNRSEMLTLERRLWLDFSGESYTVEDHLQGNVEQHWRLSQIKPYDLERVTLNGQDKVITQLSQGGTPGVDIRLGELDLHSVSRIVKRSLTLPAVGWDIDMKSLATTLYLPPGWLLLGTQGVDTSEAWFQKWTLLDLFLVLVIAAGISNLLGLRYGVMALLALGLTYHEPGAPIKLWINLIAAIGLLSVLQPQYRAYRWIRYYSQISFVLLLITLIPFMVSQIRNAIYPQLSIVPAMEPAAPVALQERVATTQSFPKVMGAAMSEPVRQIKPLMKMSNNPVPPREEEYDPSEKIQAGPGIPLWKWNAYSLSWNGPVLQTQTMRLWLLPKSVLSILKFLQLFLVAGLLYGLTRPIRRTPGTSHGISSELRGCVAYLLPLAVIAALLPTPVMADYPSDALLTELRNRLLEPPTCLPHCADVNRMQVQVTPTQLRLILNVQASNSVGIPLPGQLGKWMPRTVWVDNVLAAQLQIVNHQQLWLQIPEGVHEVVIEGPISSLNKFDLFIPIVPKQIAVSQEGWQVDGVTDQKLQAHNLNFTRTESHAVEETSITSTLAPSVIPPYVLITRKFDLGVEWGITTTVVRMAPIHAAPISLRFPLLKGERVISENVEVKDSHAIIQLAPDQSTLMYTSKLAFSPSIDLKAVDDPSIHEMWELSALSRWYCTFEGIPMVSQKNEDQSFMPTWSPWPNETLKIIVTKPQAVEGNTLSIDNSKLIATPGKEASLYELNFTARTTQGTQYRFHVPLDADIQDVQIDGISQPITAKEGAITVSLNPGEQRVTVKWQSLTGLSTFYRTPLINLQQSNSNSDIQIVLSQKERWLLLLGGPAFGPAILFWGVLFVVLLVAVALGRSGYTPLRSSEWLLLSMGITLSAPIAGIFIVLWFIAMQKRRSMVPGKGVQTGLVMLTFLFIVSLFTSISEGLLDLPAMQLTQPIFSMMDVAPYSPTQYLLRWYQDNSTAQLPTAWVVSAPLTLYRMLMLLWALWFASLLVKWLRWGWDCFSMQGYWPSSSDPKIS